MSELKRESVRTHRTGLNICRNVDISALIAAITNLYMNIYQAGKMKPKYTYHSCRFLYRVRDIESMRERKHLYHRQTQA